MFSFCMIVLNLSHQSTHSKPCFLSVRLFWILKMMYFLSREKKLLYSCCSCQLHSIKITIFVAQQKFSGPGNWFCTWNIQNFSIQLGNIIRGPGQNFSAWTTDPLLSFIPIYCKWANVLVVCCSGQSDTSRS